MRQIYCAAKLAQRYNISITGFDTKAIPSSLRQYVCNFPQEESFDYTVLPVQPLASDNSVSTPFGLPVTAESIASSVRKGGTVIIGRTHPGLAELFPYQKIKSYLDRKELLLKNAVLTAEGAVQIALEKLDISLNELSVLIVGLGRIGTSLALILRGFGADISAAVRSPEAEAKAHMLGIKAVSANNLDGNFSLVFNTAPSAVFTDKNIDIFKNDTLFIELASDAAGFDPAVVSMLGSRLICANGLPGKTAPLSAGEIIADAVTAIIEEGGGPIDN